MSLCAPQKKNAPDRSRGRRCEASGLLILEGDGVAAALRVRGGADPDVRGDRRVRRLEDGARVALAGRRAGAGGGNRAVRVGRVRVERVPLGDAAGGGRGRRLLTRPVARLVGARGDRGEVAVAADVHHVAGAAEDDVRRVRAAVVVPADRVDVRALAAGEDAGARDGRGAGRERGDGVAAASVVDAGGEALAAVAVLAVDVVVVRVAGGDGAGAARAGGARGLR